MSHSETWNCTVGECQYHSCSAALPPHQPEVQIKSIEIHIQHSKYTCKVEKIVSETNRVKQFFLWGYRQNLQQLSNSAFNDHSKSTRKWSNAVLSAWSLVTRSFCFIFSQGNGKGKQNYHSVSTFTWQANFYQPLTFIHTCIHRAVSFLCAETFIRFKY